ncbi:hypothetical protein BC628DRAFT_1337362 [Trametes gibbosa]|nr:hypothetical protein BC628DRAFT_1337362 [Trametes gibbosa]UVI59137.1 Zn(2)-Cys(6)37 [Trametes gibbosa]
MSSNPSGGARALAFDPSLLAPIVRPKRTPMACLECRRRQVKCSGTTPRCERCKKKGIECTYMSLSEQRGVGGPISRSGTPHAASGTPGQTQEQYQTDSIGYDAHWTQQQQQGMQGFAASTAYPQGWRAPAPSGAAVGASQYVPQGGQAAREYPNVPMGYQHDIMQQQQASYAARSQGGSHGGGHLPTGTEVYPEGYGMGGEQAYVGGTTYNAYGHAVPSLDPAYAYQAAQMGGIPTGGDQHGATYGGQYAPQMYYDQALGQMMAVDAAGAQQWAGSTQAFQGHGFSGQQ